MPSKIWKMAEDLIPEYARKRIKDNTDIGGADLEVVEDICKEIIDLCIDVAMGKLDADSLPKKLE